MQPGRLEVLAGDVTLHSGVRQAASSGMRATSWRAGSARQQRRHRRHGTVRRSDARAVAAGDGSQFLCRRRNDSPGLPLLKVGNRPMIVNVGSILGHRGIPGSSEYCASKFALQGFSESLRPSWRPLGSTCWSSAPARRKPSSSSCSIDAAMNRRPSARAWIRRRSRGGRSRAIRRGQHEIVVGGARASSWCGRTGSFRESWTRCWPDMGSQPPACMMRLRTAPPGG